ncbi:hydroxymethylglutaryl-CoA lyase [Thermus scotoductus]|nr:hydroxymethylglutaryl-CoA lyase [Thermus scotoductus]
MLVFIPDRVGFLAILPKGCYGGRKGCRMKVSVVEVGPRDGLQNEGKILSPELRAEFCKRLSKTGLSRIEAVSFVSGTRVPQMAGAEEVIRALGDGDKKTRYVGLILNERGYDRLRDTGLKEARFAFAATETFNLRNQNASVAQSVSTARKIIARARTDGIRLGVIIGASFGCPFEGYVDPGKVLALAEQLAEAGADEIIFADTIGVAVPRQVKYLIREAQRLGKSVGAHFHNTRGTGIANAYVALEEGASVLDASIGGIGGCPFAPGASGNIATEDLVYMLEEEGIETGIDLDQLISVARWLQDILEHPLAGQVYRVGRCVPSISSKPAG